MKRQGIPTFRVFKWKHLYPKGKNHSDFIITIAYSEENLFRFAQMVMMAPFTQKTKVLWKIYRKLLKCGSICLLAYKSCWMVICMIWSLECLIAHLISVERCMWLKQLFNVQFDSRLKCLLYEGDLYIKLLYFLRCSHLC